MFKNYFLVVWRNLYCHPVFALINIIGLALGLGFAILVLQYVSYEGGYDRQYSKASDSYRIVNGSGWIRGRENYRVYMPQTLAALKGKIPEIKYAATFKERNLGGLAPESR